VYAVPVFSPADTIAVLATAPVRAAVGVVRLSGPRARQCARAILTLPRDLEPRRATVTRAARRREAPAGEEGPGPAARAIDRVVATFFPAPQSYTGEDVVEISAHGSVALLREILLSAIDAGARLAEPGEFTLRAFLNGRMDLVQAEAVADLVDAVTPLQARVAFDQLEGTLTRAIAALDGELFDLTARLEASVDFPDEGFHFIEAGDAARVARRVIGGIDALLATAARGRLVREGRQIAILGRPNVGKSSLFNWLVGADRAIVSSRPGTTRDMLTEAIDLDGIRLGLVDTAGIRSSEDEVEREAVSRGRRAAAVADLVLLVLDRSRPLDETDRALLRETAGAARIVVINKTDLAPAWSTESPDGLARIVEAGRAAAVSLKTGAGLEELRSAMRAALEAGDIPRDGPVVANARHEALLRAAREPMARALANLEAGGEQASEELVLADLSAARRCLEEVTGRRTSEDVLKRIFERFCVGK